MFLVNNNADTALATLRYRLKDATFEAAEEPFEAAGHKFNRGSFISAAWSRRRSEGDGRLGLRRAPSRRRPG